MREHAYWWQSGSHGVSLSDRQVVAVWLEVPAGSELPGAPRSVNAQARDGKASLEWGAPPEVPSKPVTSYEYQQEGTETWNSTGGTATTKEVTGLANGESYTFRVRAVNAAGKGAASAPTPAVTPAAPGLTGSFESVPEAHDGSSAFALRLAFSEDVAGRFRRMRNDVFEVAGGAVTDLRRVDRRRDLWTVTVTPSSDDAVTVAVPANRACDVSGAVCTADGEQLSSRAEATVPGPQPAVSVSASTSPVTEGTAAVHIHAHGRHGGGAEGDGERERGRRGSAGTPPTEAVFAAGSATVDLTMETEDDEVVGDGSVVTVSLVAGTGYAVDANASAATVTVEDDDAAVENAAPRPADRCGHGAGGRDADGVGVRHRGRGRARGREFCLAVDRQRRDGGCGHRGRDGVHGGGRQDAQGARRLHRRRRERRASARRRQRARLCFRRFVEAAGLR